MSFIDAEWVYLIGQWLGCVVMGLLFGEFDVVFVMFWVIVDGYIEIDGFDNFKMVKWCNVMVIGRVVFVVDDLVSIELWLFCGVKLCGVCCWLFMVGGVRCNLEQLYWILVWLVVGDERIVLVDQVNRVRSWTLV